MTNTSWKKNHLKRLIIAAIALELSRKERSRHSRHRTSNRHDANEGKRQPHSVEHVYEKWGPEYFRRAFRMSYECFMRLASFLPHVPTVRLACAIRYFAGGSSDNIATTFGVTPSEISKSVWEVVDALNKFPGFDLEFPTSHQIHEEIALGFKNKSDANFDSCVGAIDGILIWINRPSKSCCDEVSCDELSFYCEQKHKYGLNCQAICDSKGRFLDISILYGGGTADFLAFEGMSVYHKLEKGLLAPGLCLFGDNAYLNAPYMATPYPEDTEDISKDAYNFYHSQLRIQIECAFGKFLQRWGIFRTPLPKTITIKKAIALVLALARLHNFCIDEKQSIDAPLAVDARNIERMGSVRLEVDPTTNVAIPRNLLDGGAHFDGLDLDQELLRFRNVQLPRERLLASVIDQDLKPPIPRIRPG